MDSKISKHLKDILSYNNIPKVKDRKVSFSSQINA